jgi:hypothetical protein
LRDIAATLRPRELLAYSDARLTVSSPRNHGDRRAAPQP